MSTLDMEWIWTKCHMLSSCSISLLKLTFTVSQSWTAGGWWIETSLKPRVNRTLKRVQFRSFMNVLCVQFVNWTIWQNQLTQQADLRGRARNAIHDGEEGDPKIRNPESGVWNPESGIIEIENEDRKTSLQQCVMNKYQFSIFPAPKNYY